MQERQEGVNRSEERVNQNYLPSGTISSTQEAEAQVRQVWGQHGQLTEILSQKKMKRAGDAAHLAETCLPYQRPWFDPQYHTQNTNKQKPICPRQWRGRWEDIGITRHRTAGERVLGEDRGRRHFSSSEMLRSWKKNVPQLNKVLSQETRGHSEASAGSNAPGKGTPSPWHSTSTSERF